MDAVLLLSRLTQRAPLALPLVAALAPEAFRSAGLRSLHVFARRHSADYARWRWGMAQTRATSKALKGPLGFVISLAGYQTTPAEEMTFIEADTAPQPAPKPTETIDDAAAAILASRADEFGLLDTLQLAASHVASYDVGDCSTQEKARVALTELSPADASRLDAWISKKADEQAV